MLRNLLILTFLTTATLFLYSCKGNNIKSKTTVEQKKVVDKASKNIEKTPVNKKLPTTNIKRGQKIISPLLIEVNSQGVWFASEGELGHVSIVDENNNALNRKGDWGILASVDGNWMHSNPALFEAKVNFDTKGASKGKIIIRSNPGEGDGTEAGNVYSLEIPVSF